MKIATGIIIFFLSLLALVAEIIIWQMERRKFYSAKSVPTEWKEGSAEARITEIRFAAQAGL